MVFLFLDGCQPVDAGIGQLLKVYARQEQSEWLLQADNLEKWTAGDFSIKDIRILITIWFGEAYLKLQNETLNDFRLRCFTKTGCGITASGEDDNLINPEGLPDFFPIPPSPSPGLTTLPRSNLNDFEDEENEPELEDDNGEGHLLFLKSFFITSNKINC